MKLKSYEEFVNDPEGALLEIADRLLSESYPTDLYTAPIINRTMAINEAYFKLINSKNYTTAFSYLRLQFDNCLACYAGVLVKDPLALVNHFIAGKDLYRFKDARRNNLYEKYLAQEMNKEFPSVKVAYKFYNNFIHLSNEHFKNSSYMKNNQILINLFENDSCDSTTIEVHTKNLWLANKMIAQILINFWLADKKEQLEKIEQEVSKGRSKAEIVKSINYKYPNIKNFFERGTN